MVYAQHPFYDFYYFEKYNIAAYQVEKFSTRNYNMFLSLCKDENGTLFMTSDINTEWVFRTYSATKMVMVATFLLNNADYCMDKNVMVSVPYLLYYAAFSSARAFLYASPFTETNNLDKLVTMTHSKVLKLVPDLIKNHFDKALGNKIDILLNYLRNQRELFSYKFPASGIHAKINFDEIVDVCGLLVELAELSSYKIQEVYEKKFTREMSKDFSWTSFNWEKLQNLYSYDVLQITGEELCWVDTDDWYRADYIQRKIKHPTSIKFTMTEGMTEDFFGAWYNYEENGDDCFNPDANWNRIFPIP